MICSVNGCDRPIHVQKHGYCRAHYLRWYRYGDPLAGGTATGATVEWLAAQVGHDGEGCLTWPFSRNPKGYGQTWWNGQPAIASRVMCILANGEPPTPEHQAAHSCGNGTKGCVHPRHLSWKTSFANQQDRLRHGGVMAGKRWSWLTMETGDAG